VIKAAEEQGIKRNTGPLSVLNLAEVVKIIPRMQIEFDRLLGPFIDKSELKDLKQHEQKLYQSLWNLWYIFVIQPEKNTRNTKSLSMWTHDALTEARRGLQKECKKLSDNRGIVRIVSEKLSWDEKPALWIIIDGKDALKPFEVLTNMVTSIRKSMGRVSDILRQQYITDFYWPNVVLIPLVRGKSLSGAAWRWPLLTILYNEDIKWWQLIQQPVPPEAMLELNIPLWDNPRLEPAQTLLMSYGELTAYVNHIADFLRIPQETLDEQGTAILKEHLDSIRDKINRTCQSLLGSISTIANRANELNEREDVHPFPIMPTQKLNGLKDAILPSNDCNGTFILDLQGFGQWSEQLGKAIDTIMDAYLFWVSDVIGQS
jgi:hypothetical protein